MAKLHLKFDHKKFLEFLKKLVDTGGAGCYYKQAVAWAKTLKKLSVLSHKISWKNLVKSAWQKAIHLILYTSWLERASALDFPKKVKKK